MSINVGRTEEGDYLCELNNATNESPSLSGLTERKGYTYYGVEVKLLCLHYSMGPSSRPGPVLGHFVFNAFFHATVELKEKVISFKR